MATVSNTILGKLSGSIGDVTFRKIHGKTFLVSKPSSYTTPRDASSVQRRNVFGFACKLASVINAVKPLQSFWQTAAPKNSSAFHAIVQTVFKNVTAHAVTDRTPLVPFVGFNLHLIVQSVTSAELQCTIQPLSTTTDIDPSVEKRLQLIAVLVLSNPANTASKPFQISSLVSTTQTLVLNQSLQFSLPLDNTQSQQFTQYTDHQLLLTLITLKENNIPVHCSTTTLLNPNP